MPVFGPTSRRDLVRCLLKMGFEGPYSGGKHQFMLKGRVTLTLPNPHKKDISPGLLSRILRQAGISRKEWEQLG
ncbi:MAG: type II toxin-antitoxin system HicA family toxin [Planctomycetota bacterium]